MKHFSDYILEKKSLNNIPILEDVNGDIIVEGFWKKLKSLFGFGEDKMDVLSDKMNKWSDDFKNAFTVAQYMAAKSKQDSISKLMNEYIDAIVKSDDDAIKFLKKRASEIIEKPEIVKDKNVSQVYLAFMKNLAELSTNANDNDGVKLAKKGAKVINKQNSEIKGEYEKTSKQVEKVEDGPTKADTEGEKEGKKKEVTEDEIKSSVSDNKDILEPLVKALNGKVDGTKLTNLVNEIMSKDPAYKGKSKAARTSNIVGLSAIICGAMIMTSPKCLDRVSEWIGVNKDKLKEIISPVELKLNTGK